MNSAIASLEISGSFSFIDCRFLSLINTKINNDRFKDILKDDYDYFLQYGNRKRKIKYLNGVTLNIPKWLIDINGKQVLSIFKQINPNIEVKDMLKLFYKSFTFIPEDLLTCYNEIICFNIAYDKNTKNDRQ